MNIVVLGGGTAGWLTALLAKQFYQHHKVIVVESSEIGVLGAGEGTVPHIVSVLDTLNIPVSELIQHCDATIKTGIRFTNWNGDDTSYFHPFHGNPGVSLSSCDLGTYFTNITQTKEIAMGKQLSSISELLADQCRVPFSYANSINSQFDNPMYRLQNHAHFALHFNARKLADYLKTVAIGRGIVRVDSKVSEVHNDEDGNINVLLLEDGRAVPVDFVFDCSGFARLLVGKHYNTVWDSYNNHLPLDTALPFFIPHDNTNIHPETESIAMKHGWVWKIPVQDRYGCGYVFDSKYINEAEALAEVEEYFGMKLESPKTFKFKAGSYKETYVKNCMAVGLAQSFVEPLEATSILISCMNLLEFLQNDGVTTRSEIFRKQFNQHCCERNNEVVEFLYLHYMTRRNDSEFWKNFRSNTEVPIPVVEKLALWHDCPPGQYTDSRGVFSLSSWLHITSNLGLLNPVAFAHRMVELNIDQQLGNRYESYFANIQHVTRGCMRHEEFIDFLKNN